MKYGHTEIEDVSEKSSEEKTEPYKRKYQDNEESDILKRFIICDLHLIFFIRVIKSRSTRYAGHATCIREIRNEYLGVHGRIILKWTGFM